MGKAFALGSVYAFRALMFRARGRVLLPPICAPSHLHGEASCACLYPPLRAHSWLMWEGYVYIGNPTSLRCHSPARKVHQRDLRERGKDVPPELRARVESSNVQSREITLWKNT